MLIDQSRTWCIKYKNVVQTAALVAQEEGGGGGGAVQGGGAHDAAAGVKSGRELHGVRLGRAAVIGLQEEGAEEQAEGRSAPGRLSCITGRACCWAG